MKKCIGICLVLIGKMALALDMGHPLTWTGFYLGLNEGWALTHQDPLRLNSASVYLDDSNAQLVNRVGSQRLASNGFATGVDAGLNFQFNSFLLGFETDVQMLHWSSIFNSGKVPYLGVSDAFFTNTSYVYTNWMMTFRPRLGVLMDNYLAYITGGLALTRLHHESIFVDNQGIDGLFETGQVNALKTAFTLGAGIEKPVTGHLNLKAEYLYVGFPRTNGQVLSNSLKESQPDLALHHSTALTMHLLRLGLHYHFGDPWSRAHLFSYLTAFEAGARVWFSQASLGAPQPLMNGQFLFSQLIYNNEAYTGETFARLIDSNGFFVKGFLGAGGILRGEMHDEDFPGEEVYSNTVQGNNSGHLAYANLDLGYFLFTENTAKFGPFIGYHYLGQHINTYGCRQVAGDSVCTETHPFPENFLGIAEDNHIHSLRLGLSSQFPIMERLIFTAETAYLPRVTFTGQDDHNHRALKSRYSSSKGDGMMLEATLDYKLNKAWDLGFGGRYWVWNMREGLINFDFLFSEGSNPPPLPIRLYNERYGFFVQSTYHWEDKTGQSFLKPQSEISWTGVYLGAEWGGGSSNEAWSSPFPSTFVAFSEAVNVNGFGDKIHAAGPLAGGLMGADWQKGAWVLGLIADLNAANIGGENTCFTGIGGVNCRRTVHSLGSLTGRLGYAFGPSLLYAKGGGAWRKAGYEMNANTGALSLGSGQVSKTTGGKAWGLGLEYRLSPCVSTFFEYDYVHLNAEIRFPSILEINQALISVEDSMNLFKLGLNYRFNV